MADGLAWDIVFSELIDKGANEDGGEKLVEIFHQLNGAWAGAPEFSPENAKHLHIGDKVTAVVGQMRRQRRRMGLAVEKILVLGSSAGPGEIVNGDRWFGMVQWHDPDVLAGLAGFSCWFGSRFHNGMWFYLVLYNSRSTA